MSEQPSVSPRSFDPRRMGYLARPLRRPALVYVRRALGLLGVAIVSGLAWWLIKNHPWTSQPDTEPLPSVAVYQFTPFHGVVVDRACADHATERIAAFFQQHPCQQLTRSLYTTDLAGQTVVTSVSVVRMTNAGDAMSLRQLSDQDSTGHIRDLVEEHVATVPGGPTKWLQDGGYYSRLSGETVMIATTEYRDAALDTAANLRKTDISNELKAVSEDALQQGLGQT